MGDITTSVFDLIETRSFSSLWYWIMLVVLWSSASHWVLGVPFDMVPRARKEGGARMADLEALTRIKTHRLLVIGRLAGPWLIGIFCFVLAGLFTAGFIYGIEFAQASFLLLFPLAMIWLLSLNTASQIEAQALDGEALCQQISRHRFYVQILGMLFIFVTAMWGMYHTFSTSILGN